jgi:hypothetical protein
VTDTATPIGIDRERHVDLDGRHRHVWQRRLGIVLLALVSIAGLLDVFGQRATYSDARSAAVSLHVDSPSHVRGGLIFTTEFLITPHTALHDAQLRLASGWFQAMTFNGLAPQPSSESAQGRWEVYDFGPLPADVPFPVWISWQVNPTNVGRHSQDVAVYNGDNRLVGVNRTITVFP